MALESIFSWLFKKEKDETQEAGEAETREEAAVQAEPPPAPADPLVLELEPEHAVYQLWRMYQAEREYAAAPSFRLAGPGQQADALAEEQIPKEMSRLRMAVNMAANRRLKQAVPRQTGDEIPPPPDLDAQTEIFVSSDKLWAWLFVLPPVGQGRELDRGMLEQALREKKVSFGLDTALLERIPQAQDRYLHLFPVAAGTPALNGLDGRVVDLFNRQQERTVTMDEYNRVDYASLNSIQNVEEGGVICRLVPPTQGQPGRTVLDEVIPAKDGKAATIPVGRNTQLSEDGSSLIATRTGHVEFTGRTFQVRPVLEIGGNVDFSTGNLNFLGDVHIQGDVCTGFEVRAMGSVTVEGVVEACTIEAGGDLIMVKGAQGGNQAVLRASRSVFAKYVENCCVYAKNSLQTDCIINCQVYCDGAVEVRSGRGTIVGGSVRAAHEVNAAVVGARSERPTEIILGGLPCQAFDRDLLIHEVEEMEEEMERIQRQPDSPSKLSRMGKLRMQLSLNRIKLEQATKELEQTEESPGLRRLSGGVVYPGTAITIGKAYCLVRHETRSCEAILVGDEISLC